MEFININDNDEIQNIMGRLDSISYNHSVRVWELAAGIEKYYEHEDNLLSQASFVHDIGKIYIPNSILDKTDLLDIDERDIIDRHAYLSYRILKKHNVDERICRIALYHHGTKKPCYRKVEDYLGEDIDKILKYANMLESIDMYEALTSDRPYHKSRRPKEAIRLMKDCKKDVNKEVIEFISLPEHYSLY